MASGHFSLEAEEEYLETLYEFWEKDDKIPVRTKDLAMCLEIKDASVTGMIQKLSEKELVNYEKYKGVTLTKKGLKIGRQMKRRHRLLECLLIDVMGFKGDAHEAACRMEHAINDELEVSLSELLGNPKKDPSGCPIPPPENDLVRNKINLNCEVTVLNSMKNGQSGVICAILFGERTSDIMSKMGLEIGLKISKNENIFQIEKLGNLNIDSNIGNKILIRIN
jgi:DtxR family Mn-dependent transcriptional regulator